MGFHSVFLFCGSADISGQRETLKTSVLFRGTLDPKTWLKIPPVFYPRGIDINSLGISPTWFTAERSSARMCFSCPQQLFREWGFFSGNDEIEVVCIFLFWRFSNFQNGRHSIDIPCISSSYSSMVLFHILSSRAFDVLNEDVLEWFEYSKNTSLGVQLVPCHLPSNLLRFVGFHNPSSFRMVIQSSDRRKSDFSDANPI